MVSQSNVMNLFAGMDGFLAHDPPGKWVSATSICFDISVVELFWTLSRGFTVIVADGIRGEAAKAEQRNATVADLVREHHATHFQCTPSLARILLADAGARENLASLRQVVLGGEPLEIDLAVDVIQPQLDELGPLADQVAMLGDHVPMAAAADGYANHGTIQADGRR